MWEEDWIDVRPYLDSLAIPSDKEVCEFLREAPELLWECVQRIRVTVVNEAALALFNAPDFAELSAAWRNAFPEEAFPELCRQIAAYTRGSLSYETLTVRADVTGQSKYIYLKSAKRGERYCVAAQEITCSHFVEEIVALRRAHIEAQGRSPDSAFHQAMARFIQSRSESPAAAPQENNVTEAMDTRGRELNAPDGQIGQWEWDIASNTRRMSAYWDELLGYTAEESGSAKNWERSIHPDDLPAVVKALQTHLDGYTPLYQAQYRLKTKQGAWVWISSQGKVTHRDAQGKPLKMSGVFFDITAPKQREMEYSQLQTIYRQVVEQGPFGLAVIDLDLRWIAVNQALCSMLGYCEDELKGITCAAVTHPDDKEADVALTDQLVRGEIPSYRLDKRYIAKSGDIVWVTLTRSLLKNDNGDAVSFLAIVENISERKKYEELLQVRAEEITRSNEELQRFAYIVSHDLQEPLRNITSCSQLLERRMPELVSPEAKKILDYIVDSTNRMRTMIEDLLDYSRVSFKGKELKPGPLDHALDYALANLGASLRSAQAVVHRDPLPDVMADLRQLAQVFQNLIGNAIKFRNAEPPVIRIRAYPHHRKGEWVVSVKDNGIGIAPEYFEGIFGVFQRLHTRTEYPGTGIGLSLAKKIVERHGGAMWVESKPHEGANFLFTLKAALNGKK